MSNTNNVKLGVCRVSFGGVDLGYTQGGVEVEVKTETHQVMVDQFGKSVINEVILSRNVSVKTPLAETTLDNLVRIMPGAVITETAGVKASDTLTFSAVAVTAVDGFSINGVAFSALTVPLTSRNFGIGTDATTQAAIAAAAINAEAVDNPNLPVVATSAAGVVTITAQEYDSVFYSFNVVPVTKIGTVITVASATLAGGTLATKAKVVVPTGIGQSLLAIAKPLVLHPVSAADTDHSDDFTIPFAQTAGALQFAYQLEKERIYNVTFNGYPDPTSPEGNLFIVGDPSAS